MTSASLTADVQVAVGRQLLRRRRHRLSEASVSECPTLDRRRVDVGAEVVAVERIENLVISEALLSDYGIEFN